MTRSITMMVVVLLHGNTSGHGLGPSPIALLYCKGAWLNFPVMQVRHSKWPLL